MNEKTNIYILTDASVFMRRHSDKLQATVTKTARALSYLKQNTELFIIGYRDRACNLYPRQRIAAEGNPNLGAGLQYLKSVMRYVQKYNGKKTRSIILLYSSGNVLYGWEEPLNELFRMREFGYGLRYVITYQRPEREAERAFEAFTDSRDRILFHFSEHRLCSLVKEIHRLEKTNVRRYNRYMTRR